MKILKEEDLPSKQDFPTYHRTLKILKRLNSGNPFYTAYLSSEINEDEKDIRSDLAKLRKIRGFPLQNINEEYSFKDDFIGLLEDGSLELIASSIAIHKLNNDIDYTTTISNILKNLDYGVFALPLRTDLKYKDIENFKAYELSYCIANEMAIRNKTIERQIRKYYYLENLLPELTFTGLTNKIKKNYIADDLKSKYLISVYHCEINYFGKLSSIEYSKDKQNDLFGYNEVPIDSLLKRQVQLNTNEKYELETYQKIDFRNIMSNKNPDGFKLSQEYTNDENYYSSIIPDFHRKIIDPNLVSVPLNLSLPKEELIAYISHIKDSLFPDKQKTDKSKQVLTIGELLNKERYKDHKKSKRYPSKVKASKIADYLYVYDYLSERIKQIRKPFLRDKEELYIKCCEEYKKIKKEFLYKIDLKELNENLSNQYINLEKNINAEKIDSKDLIKNKYKELLQLYTTYYMQEIPYVINTKESTELTLKDIDTITEQKIELFYKISLTYFYIIEDYRHLLKEIRRIKKLHIYKNEKIKKHKKSYKSFYINIKKDTHKILKKLKKLKTLVDPNKYSNIKKSTSTDNFLEEIHDREEENLAFQKITEEYEEKLDIYEDAIPEEDSYVYIETIHLESILKEKHLLRQFKLNKTTILDYYYAIKPYIENYNYKDLLSGVITPDELKPKEEQIKDARQLSQEQQQQIRNKAIDLFKEGKLEVKEIARKLGVHSSRIYEWKNLYKKEEHKNLDFIKIKQRGRKKGDTFISIEEQQTIIHKLINTTPKDLDLSSHLWNLDSVSFLINHIIDKKLSLSTTRNYLEKWDFLVGQKEFIILQWKNKDFNTLQWIDQTYPIIQKEAKIENAEIWWTNGIFGKFIKSKFKDEDRYKILSAANGKKSLFSVFKPQNDGLEENVSDFLNFLENILKNSNKKKYIIVLTYTKTVFEQLTIWENKKKKQVKLFFLYEQ